MKKIFTGHFIEEKAYIQDKRRKKKKKKKKEKRRKKKIIFKLNNCFYKFLLRKNTQNSYFSHLI